MKTTRRKLQVALTIISLTFLVFLAVGSTAAGRRPSLSKKEVKALIASAKTKEDQLKLADFYKAETVRLEAEAKDHDEMAEMYRKNPTPMAVKAKTSFRCVRERVPFVGLTDWRWTCGGSVCRKTRGS